jgi:hypothetical protein
MLTKKVKPQSIAWFADQFQLKKLDLEPPYQRGGEVWSPEFKNYFIDTILKNFPAPAIFLHVETNPDGKTIYHVVDGKQRLSTIFSFVSGDFSIAKPKKDYNPSPNLVGKNFKEFPDEVKTAFFEYEMPVQEVLNATQDELIQAFDRLNRNVARLTKQELRHAKYTGAFIELVENLADEPFWEEFGLFGRAKTRRMADIEFVSEIFLLTMHGILDGSDSLLDDYYAKYDDEVPDVEECRKRYETCKQLFSELGVATIKNTRFRNLGDFYSLWATFLRILDSGKKPNFKKVPKRLIEFDSILKNLPITDDLAAKYSDAVRQGTNKLANRQARTDILESVILKK